MPDLNKGQKRHKSYSLERKKKNKQTPMLKYTEIDLHLPPGGGTLGISGLGCAARTLEPLAYTRASFS